MSSIEQANSSSEPALEALARKVAAQFTERFGRPPRWMAAAPGRVNLIGEHVDYNDGFVLPAAIERWTVVAAACRPDRLARLVSGAVRESAEARLDGPLRPAEPRWSNYVRGVLAGFQSRGAA